MSFIYDNLIQRGVDYNTTTQDGYIPVNNLSVQLGDSYGATALNVLNAGQNAVATINSDGYMGLLGNLAVNNTGLTNTAYVSLFDATATSSIFLLNTDPNGVVLGTEGSIGMNYNDGYLYSNFGGTNWQRYVTESELMQSDTLQSTYLNSVPATITTNSTNGNVTIAGTQALAVTAAGGFTQTGAGVFSVNTTGAAFSVNTSGATSNVTVSGADLVLNTTTSGNVAVEAAGTAFVTGQNGVVVDGYGNGLIPAVSNTDALGSATNGWSNLYIENVQGTAVVSLLGAGTASANTTSGASAVGTNALNFASFGPLMTANTVQSALGAIDAYFVQLGAPNGDGYIGSNPADYTTFGPSMTSDTVAGALSAIDGYLASLGNSSYTTTQPLFLQAAVLNGNAVANNISETPSIDMKNGALSKMLWTMPVPGNWDGISNFNIQVLWSPSSTNTGSVEFELEYKTLDLTNLVTTAPTTVTYTTAASGTANALQSTANNLTIPGSAVSSSNSVIVVNLLRLGASDTFTGNAQVHLVNYSYNAKNVA